MSISSIQADSYQNDFFTSQKRSGATENILNNRNTGPDTLSLSPEALELARQAAADSKAQAEDAASQKALQQDQNQENRGASLKEHGFNLIGLMMDSLFMAQLEEGEQSARAVADGMPEEQAGVMEDSGKVAEMKKVINDVMTGKADISDLPKAMSLGSGDARSTNMAGASSAKRDKTQNNE